MFTKGDPVRCILVDDETADGKHQSSLAVLSMGQMYHMEEFNTPEECAKLFPEQKFWQENGGRMILQELPKLRFFGKRFARLAVFCKDSN